METPSSSFNEPLPLTPFPPQNPSSLPTKSFSSPFSPTTGEDCFSSVMNEVEKKEVPNTGGHVKWGRMEKFEFLSGQRHHGGPVTCLCLSNDGNMVYSVGKDGKLKVFFFGFI